MYEETEGQAPAEFDLNDPTLTLDLPEDFDPEGELKDSRPMPPPDGPNPVVLKLDEDYDGKPAVYFSTKNGKNKIVARFRAQVVKDDGEPGQFLKDYYATTMVFQGQTTSALAALCHLAGRPLRAVSPKEVIQHVYETFRPLGETGGLRVTAKTKWVKSTPALDPDTGAAIPGQYDEVKGQKRITDSAVQLAQHLALVAGLDEDAVAKKVAEAMAAPHVYIDPVSGEERTVRAEVDRIIGK